MGHFASVCHSAKAKQAVHTVDQSEEDSDADYIFANHASAFVIHSANLPTCKMSIGNTTMTAMIDSGASVNVLDSKSSSIQPSHSETATFQSICIRHKNTPAGTWHFFR